ncbi:VCBS repeat-containing protein [candidate division KSB1 bacterium]|nr:VCBS repeat-containing protein [candidate division KSB1 bacterium]
MKNKILYCIFIINICATSFSLAQTNDWDDVPDNVKRSKAYKRLRYFYEPRMYPLNKIPMKTYFRARNQAIAQQHMLLKSTVGQDITWKTLGPHGSVSTIGHWGIVSGRVRAIAVDPNNASRVFIGAASGGIWRSFNGGIDWTDIGDGMEALTFGAIEIDPNNTDVIYAGTGEWNFSISRTYYAGNGIYKSTDGGDTWQPLPVPFDSVSHVSAISISPFNSGVVFATTSDGQAGAPDTLKGVWRSLDAGATWNPASTIPGVAAHDVKAHPAVDSLVYAAVGSGIRSSSGVWKSVDNGATWQRKNIGLPPATQIHRIHLAVSRANTNFIYAVIYTNTKDSVNTQVFKSSNRAESWFQIAPGYKFGSGGEDDYRDQGYYDLFIAANPSDANEVYVGNVEIHQSTDGVNFNVLSVNPLFHTWTQSPMHVDYHKMVFAPSNPQIRYVGCDGGLYRSGDGGTTWTDRNEGLNTLQFYRIAVNPNRITEFVGGAQDNGIMAQFDANPGSEQQWTEVSTGDGFACLFDPVNADRVYASTQNLHIKRSDLGLANFRFLAVDVTNGINDKERDKQFTGPFLMHPRNTQTLFAATTRMYRSDNRGDNWSIVSNPIDSSNVVDFDIHDANPLRFVACTASKNVWVSDNDGKDWTDKTSGLPTLWHSRVKFSPHDENTIFVVNSGFSDGKKIYRSTDFGDTWENISGNLPNVPCNDLFIDPHIPDNLQMYVANDVGVYSTNDGGQFWQLESNGMPIVPAIDFDYVFSERLLVVATHGRSAFQTRLPLISLALFSPNGGEKLAVDAEYEIRWVGNGFSNPETIRLEYSIDNGTNWDIIEVAAENDGSYLWRVPNTASNQARVRVVDPDNNDISDESNAPFEIFVDPQFEIVHSIPFTNDISTFTGASWGDYDNDGDPDLAFTSEATTDAHVYLLRNNGSGSFSKVLSGPFGEVNKQSNGCAWGDYDSDGDLDLFIVNIQPPNSLFRYDGGGNFVDVSETALPQVLVECTSASWADIERDNRLDLFVTTGPGERNMLFRQTTPGHFVHIFFDGEFDSRSCAFGDYNNDGYPDLYVGNYDSPNNLYVNNHDGSFSPYPHTLEFVVHDTTATTSVSWGDYDNDGFLDLAVVNGIDTQEDALYINQGNGHFGKWQAAVTFSVRANGKSGAWSDYDNDGDLDFYVANDGQNVLYKNVVNEGLPNNIKFLPQPDHNISTTIEHSNSMAWADIDSDGDLDLVIANGVVGTSDKQKNMLVKNKGNGNNWLEIRLVGRVSNATGIGAKVKIKSRQNFSDIWQVREISGQTGKGQNSMVAHFGLKNTVTVDSIVVEWPSRSVSTLGSFAANQVLTIYERETNYFVQTSAGDLTAVRGKFVGGAWGDFNNDGWEDVLFVNSEKNNVLLQNTGNGNLNEVRGTPFADANDRSTGASWGDFNNDGYLDLFITNTDDQPNFLYQNQGPPNFGFAPVFTGQFNGDKGNSTSGSWGDYNNDGFLDLFVSNGGKNARNFLYRNEKGENFVRVTNDIVAVDEASSSGANWVDINNDGDIDLFVTNDDGVDDLYENSGAPDFKFNRLENAGKLVQDAFPSIGSSWGDFNNDGFQDVYITRDRPNRLYLNNGNNTFKHIADGGPGVEDDKTSFSSAWGDWNSDGYLDITVTNSDSTTMYMNTTENSFGKFIERALALTGAGHVGASWSDADNDGNLDLLITNLSPNDPSHLFKNTHKQGKHWLQVQLIGTKSNKAAIGAKVLVKAVLNSKLGTPVWQNREIFSHTGRGNQNSLIATFGFGPDGSVVDSLVVNWPGGTETVLTDVPLGQRIVIREESDKASFNLATKSNISGAELSSSAAWADVDSDGDDDLYITHRGNRSNVLYINDGEGQFKNETGSALVKAAFNSYASSWADYDNDGGLDVVIANLNESNQFFINRGGGEFTDASEALGLDPAASVSASWGDFNNDGLVDLAIANSGEPSVILENMDKKFRTLNVPSLTENNVFYTSVSWADFDRDGDADVFFTCYDQENRLLRNDAKGDFTLVTEAPFSVDQGKSNGASWGDFNNDGFIDLYITNEGGPNFLYRNNGNGRFSKVTHGAPVADNEPSFGSAWVDFDNDGDLDLMVANMNKPNTLFRNLGNGAFEKISDDELSADSFPSTGIAWADIDRDGDVDAMVANLEKPDQLFLNESGKRAWIQLQLIGRESNRAAIGARIHALAQIDGRPIWQMREISAQTGGGNGSQNSLIATFGLANASKVDSLVIYWPNGFVQIETGMSVNKLFKIEEEQTQTDVASSESIPETYKLYQNFPNPFNPVTSLQYQIPERSHVRLVIYNMLGAEVAVVVDKQQPTGVHTTLWDGTAHASGVYLIRMDAESLESGKIYSARQKMMLIK